MRPPISISVIIPTHRMDENFNRCLESVVSCEPSPGEVIVVLDGLVCDEIVESRIENLKVVSLPGRRGPSSARNAGAKAAVGDILLFIDGDVVVPPSTCRKVMESFSGEEKVDGVFGSYDTNPAGGVVSQYKNLLHHFTHQNSGRTAFTFWTGCGALKKDVLHNLGGFDEQFTEASIEDIEFGYRLKKNGGLIILDKDIQVTHLKKWHFTEMLKTDFFLRAIPWSRLIFSYGTIDNDMNINWSSRLSALVCLLMLASLAASVFHPALLFFFVVFTVAFFWLNRKFFLFLKQHRGISVVVGAIPLHFIYYLLSIGAFFVVSVEVFGGWLRKQFV